MLRVQLLHPLDVREQRGRLQMDVQVVEHVVLQIQVVVPRPLGTETVVAAVVGQPAFGRRNMSFRVTIVLSKRRRER